MDEPKLIILVENHQYIYNKNSRDFKNINKKRQAWAAIAKELDSNADVCERRWITMRQRFSKELRIVEPSGCGVEGLKSEWPHFQSLQFLRNHIQKRRQKSNFNVLEESHSSSYLENDENEMFSTLNIDDMIFESPDKFSNVSPHAAEQASQAPAVLVEESVPPPKKTKTDNYLDENLSQATAAFKKYCESQQSKEADDEVAANMGNIVKASLSGMSPKKKLRMAAKILQLLSADDAEA